MDPASIFALVEGAGGLALKSATLAKNLKDLVSKYQQVRLTILSMAQGLDTIQLAWIRIEKWSRSKAYNNPTADLADAADDDEFLQRLARSLEVGTMVMEAFEEDLLPYKDNAETFGFRKRTKVLWNETNFQIHQDRINSQALAMSCLLQVVQLELATDRKEMLCRSEQTLRKSDESAYSIVPSRMSSRSSLRSSEKSESGSLRYQYLSFEDSLFTARVYKRNYRTADTEQTPKAKQKQTQSSFEGSVHHPAAMPSTEKVLELLESTAKPLTEDKDMTVIKQRRASVHRNEHGDIGMSRGSDLDKELQAELDHMKRLLRNPGYKYSRNDPVQGRLHHYLEIKDVKTILTILSNDYEHCKSRAMQAYGHSLILSTAYKDDLGMLTLLLGFEARVNRLMFANRPLHTVARAGNIEAMRIILEAGSPVDSLDDDGFRALHLVSMTDDRQNHIDLLISKGADIEKRSIVDHFTPLQLAAFHGCATSCQALLRHGANMSGNHGSGGSPNGNCSVLDLAIRSGSVPTVRQLLEHSLDRGVHFDSEQRILIRFISEKLRTEHASFTNSQILHVVRRILYTKGVFSHQYDEGDTLLHRWARCIWSKDESKLAEEIFGLLLHTGADASSVNDSGRSPLYIAAHNMFAFF